MKGHRTYIEEIEHATLKAGQVANVLLVRDAIAAMSELSHPVIVKVGANDGVTHDITADAVLGHKNWRGVLIEPVPYLFDRLKANYGDSRFALENIAISKDEGERPFYFIGPEALVAYPAAPQWLEMIGSFDKDFIARHISRSHIVDCFGSLFKYIETRMVPVETLASVVARHNITDITLLHIDCEGHDYAVLKSLGGMKPENIYIEHKHLDFTDKSSLAADLFKRGYRIIDTGGDWFAFLRVPWLRRPLYRKLMACSR